MPKWQICTGTALDLSNDDEPKLRRTRVSYRAGLSNGNSVWVFQYLHGKMWWGCFYAPTPVMGPWRTLKKAKAQMEMLGLYRAPPEEIL